jgi:antirestriction protein ArdC
MYEITAAQRATELHLELESKILALVSGDGWAAFLETAARFHSYSASNVLLILSQCPHASRVAGFRAWQGLGRQVRRGERSIKILAPARYKTTDETTGETRWAVRGFTVANVFDLSQTDGAELPDVRPVLLTGAGFAELYAGLAAQVVAAGFRVERGECAGANGFTDFERRVVRVRDDVEPAQAVKTLAHELAHVLLHSPQKITYATNRALCEVEAESVAYVVCTSAGVATDDYSLPYVARWANGDPAIVRATADRVIKSAQSIIAGLAAVESRTESVAA